MYDLILYCSRFQHWDVNNEDLHGDFFKRHLGDVNITSEMFRWIHNLEPSVKLFLNEYSVLSNQDKTIVSPSSDILKPLIPLYTVKRENMSHSNVNL